MRVYAVLVSVAFNRNSRSRIFLTVDLCEFIWNLEHHVYGLRSAVVESASGNSKGVSYLFDAVNLLGNSRGRTLIT